MSKTPTGGYSWVPCIRCLVFVFPWHTHTHTPSLSLHLSLSLGSPGQETGCSQSPISFLEQAGSVFSPAPDDFSLLWCVPAPELCLVFFPLTSCLPFSLLSLDLLNVFIHLKCSGVLRSGSGVWLDGLSFTHIPLLTYDPGERTNSKLDSPI